MADTKVSALSDITTNLTTDDLIYVVNDPAGSPASRKATLTELLTFLRAQGLVWSQVTAAADQDVTSNTTVADDNELKFDMDAGGVYAFEMIISYSSPAGGGTPDFKYAFAGPATLTGARTLASNYISTGDVNGTAQAGQSFATTDAVGTATTPRIIFLQGWASSTGGGTGASGFRLQWAQSTSSGSATRRLAGSILRYRKLI